MEMSDDQLAAAAGLREARTLRAIRAVESGGNPAAVRFEVHLWARTHPDLVERLPPTAQKMPVAWYAERSNAVIARGRFPYTRQRWLADRRGASRVSVESDRAAFDRALAIDPDTAVRCSSFGLFQELGATLLPLTPGDARADVAAFDADPVGMSARLFIAFMRAHPHLVEAANAHDWDAFALGYNGDPEHYAPALERAFAHAA